MCDAENRLAGWAAAEQGESDTTNAGTWVSNIVASAQTGSLGWSASEAGLRSAARIPGTLRSLLASQSRSFLEYLFGARGFGGRHAPMMSPRQLKEVIQVVHTNVGSVAPRGALVGGEVHF